MAVAKRQGRATVMIGSHIQRMYLERAREVFNSTIVVAQTEFSYSAQEISLKIVGFGNGGYVEIGRGTGAEGMPSLLPARLCLSVCLLQEAR